MKTLYLILFLLPQIVTAQKMIYKNTVNIDQPVNEDLYIAGGTVTINAPVHGDLIAAGGTIIVNDSVSNDIITAGGNITLNANTGDDIRVAGGKLVVGKTIGGDLVVTGGNVHLLPSSTVNGSLFSSGGEVHADGVVKGAAKVAAGTFVLNGKVAKSLQVKGGELDINGSVGGPATLSAAEKINIGRNASFQQGVKYWSNRRDVNFGSSVKGGKAMEDSSLKIAGSDWRFLGFASLVALLWYLGAALVFILLIQLLFGKKLQSVAATSHFSVAKSLGSGLLFFILVPMIIFLTFITLVGIPLALLMTFLFVVVVLLAQIIASVTLANWINVHYYHNYNRWRQVWTALGIFIVFKLVSLIPFIGMLIIILTVLLAFGILISETINKNRRTLAPNA